MSYVSRVTEAVAGRTIVEQAEERALIAKYKRKGTEECLRQVKSADPEPRLAEPERKIPYHQVSGRLARRPPSVWLRPPFELTLLDHNQSASATAVRPKAKDVSPNEPFDTDAKSLSENKYHGLGKYRIAVDANLDLVTRRLKKSLENLPLQVVENIAASSLSETRPEAWQIVLNELRQEEALMSHNSGPNQRFDETYVDPATATRVVKGFRIPTGPTQLSSPRQVQITEGRSAGINLGTTVNEKSFRFGNPPRPKTVSRIRRQRSPKPSTIRTRKSNMIGHKIEKACAFVEDGDIDSAVVSDEEEDWVNVKGTTNKARYVSPSSKMIHKPRLSPAEVQQLDVQRQSFSSATCPDIKVMSGASDHTALIKTQTSKIAQPQPVLTRSSKTTTDRTRENLVRQGGQAGMSAAKGKAFRFSRTLAASSGSSATQRGSFSSDDRSASSGVCMANAVLVKKDEAIRAAETPICTAGFQGQKLLPKHEEGGFATRTRTRSNTAIRVPYVDNAKLDQDHTGRPT